MRRARSILSRLVGLFGRRGSEAEMAEEIQAHLDGLAERHAVAGLLPEEARAAAQRQFGHDDGIKELCREQRGWIWLEQAAHDARTAAVETARRPQSPISRRSPGFLIAVREHEFGIRLAVGATPGLLQRMVLRQTLMPVAAGLLAGLIATYWAGKLINTYLAHGDEASFPILAATSATIFLAAATAAYLPTRRAAKLDPVVVLRCG